MPAAEANATSGEGGDIWSMLLAKEAEKKTAQKLDTQAGDNTSSKEATAIFVGAKQSGKSNIIAKFLDPKSKKEHKPTTALEYLFGRKTSESGTRLVHLWELGGGLHLSDLIKVALTKENFANAVCLVVVDLSRPDEVVDTVRYWLKIIQHRAEVLASELKDDGVDVVSLMADKAGSPQAKGIPIYIVANKYDKFKDVAPEGKKVMARTLRAMALEAGASLVYMTVADSSDKDLQSCVKVFRNLLNSNVFGTERLKVFTTDEKRALAIRAGDDKEEKIGMAPGSDECSGVAWSRKLDEDLQALASDFQRLGMSVRTPTREQEREREDKLQTVRTAFSRLSKGGGVPRRELREALSEIGCTKLAELVHSSEVGGTPQVDAVEFDELSLWWKSMLAMEEIEGKVGEAFDADEFKMETVDSTREMRDHELDKYRKACEAKIRKELALKGERKEADGKKKRRGSTSGS